MKRFLSILLVLVLVLVTGFAVPARAESITSTSYLHITDGMLDGISYDTDLSEDGEGDGWAWDSETFTLTLTNAELSAYSIQIFNPQQEVTVNVVGDNVVYEFEVFDRNTNLWLPASYSLKTELVGSGSLECLSSFYADEVWFNGPTVKAAYLSGTKHDIYCSSGSVLLTSYLRNASLSYTYPVNLNITGGTLTVDIRESAAEGTSFRDFAAIQSDRSASFCSGYTMVDENGGPVTLAYVESDESYVSVKEDGSYASYVQISNPGYAAPSEPDETVPDETQPDSGFSDVPGTAYYADAVNWAVEQGITNGTAAGKFTPDGDCTRAQIVTFLWRANGSRVPETSENPFTDVPADAWYADAVLWAVENGITIGTSDTTFSPEQTCTRAHAVTFLWRAMGKEDPTLILNPFLDVASDAYYSDAVLWAVEKGITTGTTPLTFSPDQTCTRAQIVTFLYRALA